MSYKMTFFVKMPPSVGRARQLAPHNGSHTHTNTHMALAHKCNREIQSQKSLCSAQACVCRRLSWHISHTSNCRVTLRAYIGEVSARHTSNAAAGEAVWHPVRPCVLPHSALQNCACGDFFRRRWSELATIRIREIANAFASRMLAATSRTMHEI